MILPPVFHDPFLPDPVVLGEDFVLDVALGRDIAPGATVTAAVARPATGHQAQTLLTQLSVTILARAPALVRIAASPAQTALWPVTTGTLDRLIFDLRVNEDGLISYTGRGALVTRASVTPVPGAGA